MARTPHPNKKNPRPADKGAHAKHAPRAPRQERRQTPRQDSPADAKAQLGALHEEGYAWWSTRPLHVLAFLTPLLVAYEIGLILYLGGGASAGGDDVAARQLLARFFTSMGVGGVHVPALLMVAVLLAWHAIARDPWRLRPGVLLTMWGEAILWTLPLLVLGALGPEAIRALLAQAADAAGDPSVVGGGAAEQLASMTWQARLTLSVGAGLYEDLLCRLVAIALIHLVLADVLTLPEWVARLGAVVGSAVLFAALHDLHAPGGGLNWAIAGTYVGAGLYLAIVYLWRGLGISVATHALYDVVVLVIAPALVAGSGVSA